MPAVLGHHVDLIPHVAMHAFAKSKLEYRQRINRPYGSNKYWGWHIYYDEQWRCIYRTDLKDDVGIALFQHKGDDAQQYLNDVADCYEEVFVQFLSMIESSYGVRLVDFGFGIVTRYSDG